MVNCLDSRGTGVVFFLLVIFSGFGYSCIFTDNPISDSYMTKIGVLEDHLPPDYQVDQPRIMLDEQEDQNCLQLLMVFLNSHSAANIGRRKKSSLETMIDELQYEVRFIYECNFKIQSKCPNERVNISTVLENLNVSLKALKPHMENYNFTHCLQVKCAKDEQSSTLQTITTNSDQQDLRPEHTTPTVRLKDGSSDHISGDHAEQSQGVRGHYSWIVIVGLITLSFIVYLYKKKRSDT